MKNTTGIQSRDCTNTNAMEDSKKDNPNKSKRSKSDQVRQAVLVYLQKRNYPIMSPRTIATDELILNSIIEREVSRPNSILYSCFNSDPIVIDHNFSRFTNWIKDSIRNKNYHDLEALVAPLFCHLYLEILRGGHTERAANFLKLHLPSVERSRCDDLKELIYSFTMESSDLSNLRDNFRSNKYSIKLSRDSVVLLKRFLVESAHVVILQVLQSWFDIQEVDDGEALEETHYYEDKITSKGYAKLKFKKSPKQKLIDVIAALKNEIKPMFTVHLNNIKDQVTSGIINRQWGLVGYSYQNTIFMRTLFTLKQFPNADDCSEVVIRGHRGKIYDLHITNRHLLSASQDTTLRLFDLRDFTNKMTYRGHDHPVYCISTNETTNFIVSGSYDLTARLWTVERPNAIRVCVGHTQEVTSVNFHENATYFATGSADKTVRMWSVASGEPVRLFCGSKGIIYAVSYSSSGLYLASAGEDKRLRIWELRTGKQLVEMKTGAEPIMKIVWSHDDKVLAAGTIDGNIRFWDTEAILKNPNDANFQDPISYVTLNNNLLSMEYYFDTFACLTVQSYNSMSIE